MLLVDDVISTGGSTEIAFDRVTAAGAVVTGVIPMVDRGDVAAERFAAAQRAVRRAGHLPGPRHRAGQGRLSRPRGKP